MLEKTLEQNLEQCLEKRMDGSCRSHPPYEKDLLIWTNRVYDPTTHQIKSRISPQHNLTLKQGLVAKGAGTNKVELSEKVPLYLNKPFVVVWSGSGTSQFPFGNSAYMYYNATRMRLNFGGQLTDASFNTTANGSDTLCSVSYNGTPAGTNNFIFTVKNLATGVEYVKYVTKNVSAGADNYFETLFHTNSTNYSDMEYRFNKTTNDAVGVLCVGDSNTRGYGTADGESTSYSALLHKYLVNKQNLTIVSNAGVNSKEALEYVATGAGTDYETYVKTPLNSAKRKYVIFQMGLNDINHGTSTKEETWASIDTIFDNMIADGINVIACTIPYKLNDVTGVNAKLDYINTQIKASAKPVAIFDLNSAIGTTATYFDDDLHLNEAGHAVWADLIKTWLDTETKAYEDLQFYMPFDGSLIDVVSGIVGVDAGSVISFIKNDNASFYGDEYGFAVKSGKIYPKLLDGSGYAGLVGEPDAVYQGLIATKGQIEIAGQNYLKTLFDFEQTVNTAIEEAGLILDDYTALDCNDDLIYTADPYLDPLIYPNAFTAMTLANVSQQRYSDLADNNASRRIFIKYRRGTDVTDDGSRALITAGTIAEILVYKRDLSVAEAIRVLKYCADMPMDNQTMVGDVPSVDADDNFVFSCIGHTEPEIEIEEP